MSLTSLMQAAPDLAIWPVHPTSQQRAPSPGSSCHLRIHVFCCTITPLNSGLPIEYGEVPLLVCRYSAPDTSRAWLVVNRLRSRIEAHDFRNSINSGSPSRFSQLRTATQTHAGCRSLRTLAACRRSYGRLHVHSRARAISTGIHIHGTH